MRIVVVPVFATLALTLACSSEGDVKSGAGGSGGAPSGTGGSGGPVAAGGTGGSSGTGGTTDVGQAGSGGAPEREDVRGPTPPQDGANFPFPQNRESQWCQYPSVNRNYHVRERYEEWKRDNVTADGAGGELRVKRPNEPGLEPNSTVSEGIAYGMLLAVYMNDQSLFDALWRYEQKWLNDNKLMHWYINAAGTQILGENAASDADEDMAWALVMADRQWGGSGSLDRSYLDWAKDQIQRVWDFQILEGKLLKPGDKWGGWDVTNISYFAPSYYRVFAQVTGNQGWHDVVTTSYDALNNSLKPEYGNVENGLVPAWSSSEGELPRDPKHYQYDSCRTPFRIGLDYCHFGEPRAKEYLDKISGFFSGVGAANLVDGYELNGTPRPEFGGPSAKYPGSAAFIGPAAVGAMSDPAYGTFLNEAYERVATEELYVGGTYYDQSWTVLSLLALTGNFLDYTQY